MNLADWPYGLFTGAYIPVVRISLLEYSKIHEKALKLESLEAFKMYYVMRASAPSLHRESTDSLIY